MQVASGIVIDGYGDVHLILNVLMDRAHRRDLASKKSVPDVGAALRMKPDRRAFTDLRALHEDAVHSGNVEYAVQSGKIFGAEAFGALDDRARPRIGGARLVALVVGEAANAEHHQLVDLGRIEGIPSLCGATAGKS